MWMRVSTGIEPKLRVIYQGVDASLYQLVERKQQHLSSIGRIAPIKGTHIPWDLPGLFWASEENNSRISSTFPGAPRAITLGAFLWNKVRNGGSAGPVLYSGN